MFRRLGWAYNLSKITDHIPLPTGNSEFALRW
jgi:hypothetical protein